jgi:hypothetical protein
MTRILKMNENENQGSDQYLKIDFNFNMELHPTCQVAKKRSLQPADGNFTPTWQLVRSYWGGRAEVVGTRSQRCPIESL